MTFRDRGTADVFHGVDSKAARKVCPISLHGLVARKLSALDAASRVDDLMVLPGNRLKRLGGNRFGQYSIRINDQYRICFRWVNDEATLVEITDYH
jgi:proteic killer suppression protein